MDGILLVDKPLDWTSFDVVAKIRGVIRAQTSTKPKIGHSGTLDPKATGLLVILVGTYTKRAQEFSSLSKTYRATITLGQTSTTADEEGIKTVVSPERPSHKEVEQALSTFLGDQQQTPPAYSAIKIDGQRAYKLARKGESPEMKSRLIHIFELELISYNYPEVDCIAKVSSGTFIRSLAEDIGKKLGSGAYLSQLRRTEVGKFRVEAALSPEKINLQNIEKSLISV